MVLLVVPAMLLLAITWHFSSRILAVLTVGERPWTDEVRVVRADRTTVTLQPLEEGPTWLTAGRVFGLDWGDGYGHVSDVRRERGDTVVRSLEILEGRPPAAGSSARFTREGFPRDPRRVFDVPVREVSVQGPEARLPAWFAPGRQRTWAVLIHGGRATRAEMFRLMRSTVAVGMPSLAISYRGDFDNGGGMARMGETEWPDVEAAVQHALDQGARDVVLLGSSMGGALTAAFLESSDLAGRVRAVVLDSPLLDFEASIDLWATRVDVPGGGGLPAPLTWGSMRLAALRAGLDLDAVDYLDDTSWLTVPALVLHGTSDPTVPVESSRELARLAPDRVEAHFLEGAGHVEAWNAGPRRYDRRVRTFLHRHAALRAGER